MEKNEIVSTLNDLIETSLDGDEGFRTSAEHAKDAQLKALFSNRAQSCATAVRELQDIVRANGGEPADSSSMSGALHRRWVDIKSIVTGRDDEGILNEVERGEDVAVASYRKALSKDLPSEIRALIERQYQGVVRNHDQVKQMRNQFRTQH
ncbi:MAG: PA2169 family four-helix-bundle protein [Herminiimonas sp.]|nr:PA2169 family four-helix-bundle protein [Herminiimonas sp.]